MTRTIRLALAAGTLLMVGATLIAVSGKGGGSEMHAPVFSDKLVEAKLGPTTFAFPMNLYDTQVGPDFQGSVGLAIHWPELEAFPVGAKYDEGFRRAYLDEHITVLPYYVSKVPIESLPLRYTNPTGAKPADPLANLGQRTIGEPVYGLTPHYADLDKVAAFYRSQGFPADRAWILESSDDWYFAKDAKGHVVTFIRCDTHELRGASLENGHLQQTPPGESRGMCEHMFTIPESSLVIHVSYLRAYLGDWKRIETRVRDIFATGKARGAGK